MTENAQSAPAPAAPVTPAPPPYVPSYEVRPGDERYLDLWQHPAGDRVYLPTTNREVYLRQLYASPGWQLLEQRARLA